MIELSLTFLIVLSIILPPIYSDLGVTAQAGLPLMSVAAPQTVTAPGTTTFNVSVWLESQESIDVSLFQIYMTVDDTILSTQNAWLPTENSSWVFHGKTYVPVIPARKDNDNDGVYDGVLLGSALLVTDGMASVSVTDPVLLAIVELQVRGTGTTTLNISTIEQKFDPYLKKWVPVNSTFIEDPMGEEINIVRENVQVEINGYMPTESSTITLEVSPSPAFTGQNLTITGQITPNKLDVNVKIEQRQWYKGGYLPWQTIVIVKTDQYSQYQFIHRFQEASTYELKASWNGDQTHLGATSAFELVVEEPTVQVEMRFAKTRRRHLGEYDLRVPTKPGTLNVTVRNVTDLYEWNVKIYYDSRYLEVNEIWLPNDNALNLTGLAYNHTWDFGEDVYGDYFISEGMITEVGNGYTGNATLFQFNATGLVVTMNIAGTGSTYTQVTIEECKLKNSAGNDIFYGWNLVQVDDTILFEEGIFYVYIAGEFSTRIVIVNPITGDNEFTFYANNTSVGTLFNLTIQVDNAINLYGWQVRLLYNSTLLNATRVIKPETNTTYVFYDKESTMDYTFEEGSLWINNTLTDGAPFEGDGLLAVIEFEILMLATNQTGDLSSLLTMHEVRVFTGIVWQSVAYMEGEYQMNYGAAPSEDGGTEPGWLETYWPYIAGILVIVAIVAVFLVMRMRRRQEIPS